jgi:hypothetical protein
LRPSGSMRDRPENHQAEDTRMRHERVSGAVLAALNITLAFQKAPLRAR